MISANLGMGHKSETPSIWRMHDNFGPKYSVRTKLPNYYEGRDRHMPVPCIVW